MSKGKMSRHERAIRSELETARESYNEAQKLIHNAVQNRDKIRENIAVLERILAVAEEVPEKVEAPDRSERQAGVESIAP